VRQGGKGSQENERIEKEKQKARKKEGEEEVRAHATKNSRLLECVLAALAEGRKGKERSRCRERGERETKGEHHLLTRRTDSRKPRGWERLKKGVGRKVQGRKRGTTFQSRRTVCCATKRGKKRTSRKAKGGGRMLSRGRGGKKMIRTQD